MKDFLSYIIHEAKQDRFFTKERIFEIEEEYDEILRKADDEYCLHPPKKYYPDGRNLFVRMRDFKKNHLLFLSHPDIDYTNNIAERGLRKFKRKFKQAVTFRSNESVQNLCNCMSILETRRKQGANLFLITTQAFSV